MDKLGAGERRLQEIEEEKKYKAMISKQAKIDKENEIKHKL